MDLKIKNCTPGAWKEWADAVTVAVQFERDHPEKMGIHDNVAYWHPDAGRASFYAYRTKTAIVVVKI